MTNWQMFVVAILSALPPTLVIILAQWNSMRVLREEKAAKALLDTEALKRETKRDQVMAEIKIDVNSNMSEARKDIAAGLEKIEAGRVLVEDLKSKAVLDLNAATVQLLAEIKAAQSKTVLPVATADPMAAVLEELKKLNAEKAVKRR